MKLVHKTESRGWTSEVHDDGVHFCQTIQVHGRGSICIHTLKHADSTAHLAQVAGMILDIPLLVSRVLRDTFPGKESLKFLGEVSKSILGETSSR